MGLYTKFVSSLLFPLQERLKGHDTVAVRRELEESQWWTLEQIEAHQLRRLQDLLSTAAVNVPYYRDLFREMRFDPAEFLSLEQIRELPWLTKPLIRANVEALKHVHPVGLERSSTGGSSGQPLAFFIGRERVSHDVAAKWRATRWWGVDIGDPEVVIWGSPIEIGAQDNVRILRDRLMRSHMFNAFEMTESNLDRYLQRVRELKPKMVFGYPHSITLLASHAQKRGLRLDDLGIRVVFVTSEMLYEHQREKISVVFGCPVANGYGGRDAGFIAHECPAGGMHVTAEDVFVELIDADGQVVPDGEPGEVVVTHLCSRDYPFIRYRTGDVAIKDTGICSCGRQLPLLREIQGRTNDFLVAQDGKLLPCGAFTYLMRETEGIGSFKVVQESLSLTRVQIVRPDGLDEVLREKLIKGFKHRLGQSVQIELQLVDTIAAQGNGKYRYVVSNVTGQASAT